MTTASMTATTKAPDRSLRGLAAEPDITLLRQQGVWIEKAGQRIRLGGVSDFQQDRPRLDPTIEGTRPDDFVLLVSHNPDFAEFLPPGSVDLVLSGHTHGGQMTFFGLWALSGALRLRAEVPDGDGGRTTRRR